MVGSPTIEMHRRVDGGAAPTFKFRAAGPCVRPSVAFTAGRLRPEPSRDRYSRSGIKPGLKPRNAGRRKDVRDERARPSRALPARGAGAEQQRGRHRSARAAHRRRDPDRPPEGFDAA
ncbi:hypothetical protein T210_0133235 [Burkholderia pseudomallei MSHR6137]|nr:hypothetical protein T210_0133235 [Burkholderia pseudomallei MSHR6137]